MAGSNSKVWEVRREGGGETGTGTGTGTGTDAATGAEYLAGTLRCEMENEISGIGKFIGEAGGVTGKYSYQ